MFVPSWDGSQRVFQYTSLPEKKARLTLASRAAVTFARWSFDQYSSWPTDMNILCFVIRLGSDAGVETRDVGDVVSVLLQEPDHRVLVGEQVVAPVVVAAGA